MVIGKIAEDKVVVEEGGREFYENNWYGKMEGDKLILDLIEAASLCERGKLEVTTEVDKIDFKSLLHICAKKDKSFMVKFMVYKDLRERGLPVRLGFEGSDFRVYERGASPFKVTPIKWIVFVSAEDYPCQLEQLGKAIKLCSNIKATALWAVCDNDESVTFYIISEINP